MKYYINYETGALLIDENEYTPYLADRGYTEISKELYDEKSEELLSHDERELELLEEEDDG